MRFCINSYLFLLLFLSSFWFNVKCQITCSCSYPVTYRLGFKLYMCSFDLTDCIIRLIAMSFCLIFFFVCFCFCIQEGFKMGLTVEGTVFSLDPLDGRCWCQEDISFSLNCSPICIKAPKFWVYSQVVSVFAMRFVCICIWYLVYKKEVYKKKNNRMSDHYFCMNCQ